MSCNDENSRKVCLSRLLFHVRFFAFYKFRSNYKFRKWMEFRHQFTYNFNFDNIRPFFACSSFMSHVVHNLFSMYCSSNNNNRNKNKRKKEKSNHLRLTVSYDHIISLFTYIYFLYSHLLSFCLIFFQTHIDKQKEKTPKNS